MDFPRQQIGRALRSTVSEITFDDSYDPMGNWTLDKINRSKEVLMDGRIACLNKLPRDKGFDPWAPVTYVLRRFSVRQERSFNTFREAVVAALFDLADKAATPLEIKVLGESVWRKTGQRNQDIIGELKSLRGKE